MLKYLSGALVAAALLIAPAPAQAAEQCYGAAVGAAKFFVCADVTTGASGTTVAPSWSVRCEGPALLCSLSFTMEPDPTNHSIGMTGFVPNPSYQEPCVDTANGTVRGYAGTLGTLYVNGYAYAVDIPSFVVGNRDGCL